MLWSKPKPNRALRWWAAGAFVVTIGVNLLANLLPIAGNTTAQVSDAYPNLFAPIGVTFAIWGVIYLSLGVYTLRQLGLFAAKKPAVKETVLDGIAPYFIASSLLNALWIITWHSQIIWLSVLLIVALLVSLALIYRQVHAVSHTAGRDRWLVKAPFSIYFGWVSVATIANVTTWLVSMGWGGWGISPGAWMVAVLLIGAALTVIVLARYRDWLYGAVVVWAYAGILAKHLSASAWDGQYPSVLAALYILLPVLIVAALWAAREEYLPRT